MASFIELDSIQRDREVFPNPFEYTVTAGQVDTWFNSARQIRAHPQNVTQSPLEFSTTVNIKTLTIPYSDEMASIPRIYVDFHSLKYNDIHLLHSINGVLREAKFVCVLDKVQHDSNSNPVWIHYKCDMEQAMRFRRGDPVKFRIQTRSGAIPPNPDTLVPAPPDPLQQTLCTFEITPYIRDGSYDNHTLGTYAS